jgi:two-component system response regulator YesN
MTEKLNILAAIDEQPSPVWDSVRPLANLVFVREGRQAYHYLSTQPVDIMFIDLKLSGMDSFELLRRVRTENLCPSVVLTSETPSFSFAQQGIVYGVSAYLLRPLQEAEVESQVRSLLSSAHAPSRSRQLGAQEVVLQLRTGKSAAVFLQAGQTLLPSYGNDARAFWKDFYEDILHVTYRQYPWLKIYHKPDEYALPGYLEEAPPQRLVPFAQKRLDELGRTLSLLLPPTPEEPLEKIMLYLLESVEENLQQKDVAERFYITASTLSIRFQKHLGLSYREYVTRLKLQRAQYLLRYTTVRESSLAAQLGYKDKEHFAKLFQQNTGMTMQTYRQGSWYLPSNTEAHTKESR